MPLKQASNQDIKERMLQKITSLWGVKNTDALDPLVKILVEALSGELQKVNHDIGDFEKRMLEKVANLMTPGVLSSPYCASSLMNARSVEPSHLLTPETHFFTSKKLINEKDSTDIFFTPVTSAKLFDGHVSYFGANNRIYLQKSPLHKESLLEGNINFNNNILWIGIKLNPEIKEIDKLSFHFNTGKSTKKYLHSLLQSCKCFIKGQEVRISHGLPFNNGKFRKNNLFALLDPMSMMEQEVSHLYDYEFLTLNAPEEKSISENFLSKYPEEFDKIFSQKQLSALSEELLWVKIITASALDDQFIKDLNISINTFPVINRKLKECFYRMKGITNIIPVETEIFESFLSVYSLKDTENKEYVQIPGMEDYLEKSGTYAIRKSGTERMDTRTAKEFLSYMAGLVRDEAAAFASYGQDFVMSLIKELEKTLAQLEQRTRQHKTIFEDAPYYVVVDYKNHNEAFFMRYWINNSFHANGIYAGTKFNLYKGNDVRADSILMIVNSHGGKQVLEPERHMDAYKYAILTHHKIVTAEDIKSFCHFELGDKIENVQVKKGLMKSNNPDEGLVRCVEVILERKMEKAGSEPEEWERLLETLESKLEQKSSINLRYKISVLDTY